MIIVGTAGHIDHGKTTLIRSLTGIETDRLLEEKQRGISIELGFAYLDLPGGMRVGLIDVPGHERFVHHMIAGATGVDLVILVVAADEGIMPQTKEHVAICELLGMKQGVVIITKTDLVDDEWLELVEEDVKDYLARTFLRDAPYLRFAATWEGDGLEAFKGQLYSLLTDLTTRLSKASLQRPAVMPIDRVFTIKGFGTVLTGTVQSGTLRAGDGIRLLPSGRRAKIRRLENHGQPADKSPAGTRTAVNVPDFQKHQVQRGDVIVSGDSIEPVVQLTASLKAVDNLQVELKPQFKALFHTGSSYTEAAVRLLDRNRLGAGDEAIVAIRLAFPTALLPGNRYILRAFSHVAEYGKTVGGGTILWPAGIKARPATLEAAARLTAEDPAEVAAGLAFLSGLDGVAVSDLSYLSPVPTDDLIAAVKDGGAGGAVHYLTVAGRPWFLHAIHNDTVCSAMMAVIDQFHQDNPRKRGLAKEELRSRLPSYFDREVVEAVLAALLARGELAGDELRVMRQGFEPVFDERFARLLARAEHVLLKGGMSPPIRDAVAEELGIDDKELAEVLANLVESGAAVRIASDLYFHRSAEDRARKQLVTFLQKNATATTQELKDLWGITRKYLIPLAEHYDATHVTVRSGASQRKLRGT